MTTKIKYLADVFVEGEPRTAGEAYDEADDIAAVEQGGVYRGFQIGQALAHGRCGDEFPLRRAANAAQLTHRHKQLQRGEVNAARKVAL